MNDILKDLEKDIEKRRKNQNDREKKQILSQLGDDDNIGGGKFFKVPKNIAYIVLVVLLISYIGYDRVFVHKALLEGDGDDITALVTDNLEVTTTTVEETDLDEPEVTTTLAPTTTTTIAEEGSDLSGSVEFQILEISSEKTGDDVGKINSVTFSIGNGMEDGIIPRVDVYAYDGNIEEEWIDTTRGTYNEDEAITVDSGTNHTGSVILTPKTFSNLDLTKTIDLLLQYGDEEIKITSKLKIED